MGKMERCTSMSGESFYNYKRRACTCACTYARCRKLYFYSLDINVHPRNRYYIPLLIIGSRSGRDESEEVYSILMNYIFSNNLYSLHVVYLSIFNFDNSL